MRPDPLSEAAARRHELTRAKAVQALRELDRAGHSRDIRRRRPGRGDLTVWLYTQPDISGQIRRLRREANNAGFAGGIPRASGPPTHRCAPGSPQPLTATSSSPTRTPGSAASSPAHSATSDRHGPDQVTIKGLKQSNQAACVPSMTLSTAGHRRSQPWLTRKLKITLEQRITVRYQMKGMTPDETAGYIRHHLDQPGAPPNCSPTRRSPRSTRPPAAGPAPSTTSAPPP